MRTKMVFLSAVLALMPIGVNSQQMRNECNGLYEYSDGEMILNSILDEGISAHNYIVDTPVSNYFYNLKDNIGCNQAGSCGYVALGMLLSYYDSYFNDNMIPEKYDCSAILSLMGDCFDAQSPGIFYDEVIGINESDYPDTDSGYVNYLNDYRNRLINTYRDVSLHAKLIELGRNYGHSMGLNLGEIEDILDLYFQYNTSIDKNKWVVNGVYHENYAEIVPGKSITYDVKMRNEIEALVKKEIPVLTYICDPIEGTNRILKHVVVTYNYDVYQNELVANFGYQLDGATDIRLPLNEIYITGYMTLLPCDLHTHSNNYIIDGVATCSCQLPTHTHSYTYTIKNATSHNCICYCGHKFEQSHNFRIVGKNWVCSYCGYSKPYDGGFGPGIIYGMGRVEI